MQIFNSLINSEIVKNPLITWEGTGYSTAKFKDKFDDLLAEDKNLSKNRLDTTRSPWWKYKGMSFQYCLEHRNDIIKNMGYDYRGAVLRNSLSKVMFIETKREGILNQIETIIDYLIDHVKNIKKQYNWTMDRKWRNFN